MTEKRTKQDKVERMINFLNDVKINCDLDSKFSINKVTSKHRYGNNITAILIEKNLVTSKGYRCGYSWSGGDVNKDLAMEAMSLYTEKNLKTTQKRIEAKKAKEDVFDKKAVPVLREVEVTITEEPKQNSTAKELLEEMMRDQAEERTRRRRFEADMLHQAKTTSSIMLEMLSCVKRSERTLG